MRPIVALDVETDGLHPDRKAWEIAMIHRAPDGLEEETSFFVAIDLSTSNEQGLAIGGFYDRHPMGRLLSCKDTEHSHVQYRNDNPVYPLEMAAAKIARWTHGAQIFGAVPSFDTECLAALLRSQYLAPAWYHRLRCVESMAAGHLGYDPGGLGACADALGIEHPADHTALGDCRTAMNIRDMLSMKTVPS